MKNGKIVNKLGTIKYYLNDKLHKKDGPAVIIPNGDKYWYLNDLFHREDGPAIEWNNGSKQWYKNGKLHRINGSAVEWVDNSSIKEYWIEGKKIKSKFEFKMKQIMNEFEI